jgi:hypothetical protein
MSFLIVGVASDFRYGYWAVLATIVGAVVAMAGRSQQAATARRIGR